MTVKRFVAPTARDALRRVKEELGPDAVVVANKAVPGGVEITAMSADSLDALSAQANARPVSRPVARPAAPPAHPPLANPAATKPASKPVSSASPSIDEDDYSVSLSAKANVHPPFRPWQPALAEVPPASAVPVKPATKTYSKPQFPTITTDKKPISSSEAAKPQPTSAAAATPTHAAAPPPRPRTTEFDEELLIPKRPPLPATEHRPAKREYDAEPVPAAPSVPPAGEAQVAELMAEMQTIKGLLERQLAGFAWGEMARDNPTQAMLLAEMLEAGFSGFLSRRLIDELPAGLSLADGRKWMVSAVNRRLRTLTGDTDIIDGGGIFALVGPTGVGKTTTTAKLAARCVVRYGADKLALLTTDGYRIGAHEQLRIYGRILGVPVHVVRDSEDLRRTLVDLRDRHMILIDTVGMSQRDRLVSEQAAMLARAGDVKRLLLLNTGSRGDTLDDVVKAYGGDDLVGCILTKVDEAQALGPSIDAVVRHGLLLAYVANGQRVPEDLHLPNRNYLLHRAFKLPSESSPHRLQKNEVGLVMAPRTGGPGVRGATLG